MDQPLNPIACTCNYDACPTIYPDPQDPDGVVVQGYVLDDATRARITLPDGETAVRIPRSLLADAVRNLP
jgi:hypothetical protein